MRLNGVLRWHTIDGDIMDMALNLLAVIVGGGIGAATRYSVTIWATKYWGLSFPTGTLIVNIVGCFIIGFFMVVATERWILNPRWCLLVGTGFLGGLTTFSSFTYETTKLFADAEFVFAALNVLANVVVGLIATWAGIYLAKI